MKTSPFIATRKIGEEILLYHREEGTFFVMSAAEVIIMEMLIQHRFTKEDAVERIMDVYEVSRGQLQEDLELFLLQLKENKIIAD